MVVAACRFGIGLRFVAVIANQVLLGVTVAPSLSHHSSASVVHHQLRVIWKREEPGFASVHCGLPSLTFAVCWHTRAVPLVAVHGC